MRLLLLFFCLLLFACQVGNYSSVPSNWDYVQCPSRGLIRDCDLEFPAPVGSPFEVQIGNSLLFINVDSQGSKYFVIESSHFDEKNFPLAQMLECKETKSYLGCNSLRFDKKINEIRIIAFSNTANEKEFTYFLFSPKKTYFIEGMAEDGNPWPLDISILNARPISSDE